MVLACMALCASAQPVPLKGLRLVDHRSQALGPSLQDRPTLLHFIFTTCSTTCPVTVQELAQVRRGLPEDVRARVRFVSVTVDPLHDAPAVLADYARRQNADLPGWSFATGPDAHVLVERMQVLDARRPQPADHRSSLYLYDARGVLMQRYGAQPVDRPRLIAEITQIARTR